MTQTNLEKWSTMTLILLSFLYMTIFWVEFCKVGPYYYSISAFWFKYLVLIIDGLIIALQFSGWKKNHQCYARQPHIIDKIMKKVKGI